MRVRRNKNLGVHRWRRLSFVVRSNRQPSAPRGRERGESSEKVDAVFPLCPRLLGHSAGRTLQLAKISLNPVGAVQSVYLLSDSRLWTYSHFSRMASYNYEVYITGAVNIVWGYLVSQTLISRTHWEAESMAQERDSTAERAVRSLSCDGAYVWLIHTNHRLLILWRANQQIGPRPIC